MRISDWSSDVCSSDLTLRVNDIQGQQPIALPIIDYRQRLDDPLFGGQLELQLNTLAIGRTAGQDTQRAFAGAQWNLRGLTGLGQEEIGRAACRERVWQDV